MVLKLDSIGSRDPVNVPLLSSAFTTISKLWLVHSVFKFVS